MISKDALFHLFFSRTGKTIYTLPNVRGSTMSWQGSRIQEYSFTEEA